MSEPSERTFSGDFKRFFLRGLVILLPSVLTLWIVVKAYQFVDNTIAEPINQGVRVTMINASKVWTPLQDAFNPPPERMDAERQAILREGGELPGNEELQATLRAERIRQWWNEHWYMDLIGLVIAIIVVYVAGRVLGGFVGRSIYKRIEKFIVTLPVFKQVYPYVKQIVDFLFSDDQPIKFNRVVLVEYPRKGLWTMGFQTGESLRSIRTRAGDAISVFIPSSPTPFTGYTLTVPRSEIMEIPITIEEAIRFTVSGGVLVPAGQQLGAASDTDAVTEAAEPMGLIPITDPPESGESTTEKEAESQ